jgi:O-antigen/teichoic acid export membrane protein
LFFITRYLGQDIYGSLTFSMALVATINSVSDLGFNSANIKRISEGQDIDDCVSTFITIKLCLTGLMVLLTAGTVGAYAMGFSGGLSDTSFDIIILFILYYVLYDLAQIAIYTFDAKMQAAKSQLIMIMDPVFRVPLIILVALNRMDIYSLTLAYVAGAFSLFVAAMFLLLRSGIKWRKPTMFKSYKTFALPLAIATIIGTIWGNVDKVLLGFFGSTVDLAIYNSGLSLMALLSTIGASVVTITFPLFSKYHSEGKIEEIRIQTRNVERYMSMILLPIAIVIFIFPYDTAAILLGGTFRAAGGPMRIIVLTVVIALLNQAYYIHFNSTNRNDLALKLTILSLALNSVLLLLLVPTSILGIELFGLTYMGAAYAGLITNFVVMVLTRVIVYKLSSTGSNPRILLHLDAGILSGFVLLALGSIWSVSHWYDLASYGVISYLLFLSILTVMKEFTKKDLLYFMEIANLREMWKYIRSELGHKG